MSVTHGMDTTAGLQASDELQRGSAEISALTTRLEGAIQSFDWIGPDADRVRGSWASTERPSLDAVTQQVATMALLVRQEAEAQDVTSGDATTGSGGASTLTPSADTVPRRYDDKLAALTPADRAAVEQALRTTADPNARALIREAVATGLTGETLSRYTERVQQLTPAEVAALDPATFRGAEARQPDGTTCGSSSLVMARMENNPAYAMAVLTGYDPATGTTDPGTRAERFAAESLAMHERTNGWLDRDGDLQSAWPEAWGTAPGPLANEMSSPGGSGVPGTEYQVDWVRGGDRGSSFDQMVTASQNGHNVPVYVGSDNLPRHVVLVTATDGNTLSFYEPGRGETVTVTRDQWVNDRANLGGWGRPWAIVVPRN